MDGACLNDVVVNAINEIGFLLACISPDTSL